MTTTYHPTRAEMGAIAAKSELEVVRCKLPCAHTPIRRAAVLLISGQTVVRRMVRCKLCAKNNPL